MDDGLVTCPACGQRAAPGVECQWCDEWLGSGDRPPRVPEGGSGCGNLVWSVLLAVFLALIVTAVAWLVISGGAANGVCNGWGCRPYELDSASERIQWFITLAAIWVVTAAVIAGMVVVSNRAGVRESGPTSKEGR